MIEHPGPTVDLAVNGTLMRGLELNDHMIDIGATFLAESRTAAEYRLWSIHDVHPAMIRTSAGDGASIAVEVWRVPIEAMAALLLSEPRGLAIGKVLLDDGSAVLGVIGEPT
ncbi:MAG TPA: gamma-glutamylcyclotransferase, partial [Ilumatobacteraceae bacterium]|nr:gamma-glutamylcyclotransferase [Ilumatobacteraceae bacterium]